MSDEGIADGEAAAPAGPSRRARTLAIPALSLVALIGASGSGKSTFAARHFKPTEILSSDAYRAIVGDDPNDQSVTNAAFDALHHIAGLRLRLGRLTVVDATNVKPQDRAGLIHLAREYDVLPVAIVLNLDERICREHNASRADRQFGAHVVRNQVMALRRSLRGLAREGFRHVYILNTHDEIEAARIEYTPLFSDRRSDTGPFDIIGDVHGCYAELIELLAALGYQPDEVAGMRRPDGRRAIFIGDLVDRGPQVVETVRLVMRMVATGQALCVPGNHDTKLQRALAGRNVQVKHGLAESLAQIHALPDDERGAFSRDYRAFADSLISHYVLDAGHLVVAHAGMKEAYQGRASGRVREFALYGETTGETDEFGLPVRANWAADYRGHAAVVYGHTPVPDATWLNSTIDIDTGCVFGGRLTALRWPERELISVPAHAVYAEPKRPLTLTGTGQTGDDTLLRIEDALGKQIISTRLTGNVIIEADRAAAALEVMSRFALDPRWLIYLPPTMSPCETTREPGLLEHPAEAFAYYRGQGAPQVVCEEKHMGS
ncbi:MAG: polynucleotide kinase-phosphatase, partial [Ktedonobacterales bacterium]